MKLASRASGALNAIAPADLIAGMAKGMAVLESFDTERQRLNATLAAQRAGLTRAAARRHLLTLAHLGYLETDGSYFWLSAKVLRFAGSYLASSRLPRTVQPTLNRLAAFTREPFSVTVLEGDAVVVVARSVPLVTVTHSAAAALEAGAEVPPVRLLAQGLHLGARLPAHATSTGRVLLAALPRTALAEWMRGRQLHRLTAYTVTDAKTFRTLLAEARQQDYALASEEHELGVHAVAVPLRNAEGATVAALNVVVPESRVRSGAVQRELLPLLQSSALELRALL